MKMCRLHFRFHLRLSSLLVIYVYWRPLKKQSFQPAIFMNTLKLTSFSGLIDNMNLGINRVNRENRLHPEWPLLPFYHKPLICVFFVCGYTSLFVLTPVGRMLHYIGKLKIFTPPFPFNLCCSFCRKFQNCVE